MLLVFRQYRILLAELAACQMMLLQLLRKVIDVKMRRLTQGLPAANPYISSPVNIITDMKGQWVTFWKNIL